MKSILRASLLLMSVYTVVVLTGCSSGDGASGPQTTIATHATINGVTAAWSGASLQGQATPGTYSCNPATDTSCKVYFGGPQYPDYTDSNGHYLLTTNALGNVQWTFAAVDAPNTSICPDGASDSGIPNVGGTTDLYCSQNNGLAVTTSPASCTTTYNAGTSQTTTNCPTNITITANQSIFPTAYAINAFGYNEAEVQVSTKSITATSSTSVSVPTPTTVGFSAIVFHDPTTNLVIGAAPFRYIYRTVGGCIPSPGHQCP